MAFSEYWRSTSYFPSLTASNSSSSPSSCSSLMDPSTSASTTQEWGLEETTDFIRILGMTQYHHHHHHHHHHRHDSDVNWYGDGDGDSYWLMVASKMGALGKGYPARTPLNLKSKCQHLLSTYIKVLSFFLAFLPTEIPVHVHVYACIHACMCVCADMAWNYKIEV